MEPFYYAWTDAEGKSISVNLHLDGAVSLKRDYLNWTLDEINGRIRKREDIISKHWQRADIEWRNGQLRWLASFKALLQFKTNKKG
tara:strand:- start:704 stop:961 length:258 start_codon:yes stop_codon:yes gene_type:complete